MPTSFQQLWHLMRGQRLRFTLAIAALLAATFFNYLVPVVGQLTIDFALEAGAPSAPKPEAVAATSFPTAAPSPAHSASARERSENSLLTGPMLRAMGGAGNLRDHLWLGAIAMVAFTAMAGVFSYLKGRHAALASDGIARRLKDELYDHINHLPSRYHDRADTGDLVQRCTSDVETVRLFLSVQIVEVGNAVILALTAFPLMLLTDGRMTAVSFALVLPIIAYSWIYFRRVKQVFKDVEAAESALTAVIQENLTGIRVVRAFARQEHERAKFAGPNRTYRDKQLKLLRLMAWFWAPSDFICLLQSGLVLIVGAHWVAQGQLTVGALFAFIAYLNMLLWPVRHIGRTLTDLGKAQVSLGRIHDILSQPREPEPPLPENLPRLSGALEVRDLAFSHRPDDPNAPHALNGVSFTVKPGETIAILGPSGSGKSTFVHLLLRLYDYQRGSLQLDGHELSQLPRKWVRDQIAVVMQEPFLYSKTLRENIRLGRGTANEDAIAEAARNAAIHDTITQFPEGYDTLIGERGITLSGGQRQRVALARALLREPPVLVLDDALSAVDSETESMILEALRRRHGKHTTLLIAHRLATLAHADRVIVLEHGRILQLGTHAELSTQEGLYRRLWQIQTSLQAEFTTEAANAR